MGFIEPGVMGFARLATTILPYLDFSCRTIAFGLIGNRRGSTRIWGCVGGYAAYTPPNPGVITVNPNDPAFVLCAERFIFAYGAWINSSDTIAMGYQTIRAIIQPGQARSPK